MTIEQLTTLEAKATPGPWRHVRDDDSYWMSMHTVTYDNWEAGDDVEDALNGGKVICATLLQTPARIGHPVSNGRWAYDAALIAAARNALPALLEVAMAAKVLIGRNNSDDWFQLNDALNKLEETK